MLVKKEEFLIYLEEDPFSTLCMREIPVGRTSPHSKANGKFDRQVSDIRDLNISASQLDTQSLRLNSLKLFNLASASKCF